MKNFANKSEVIAIKGLGDTIKIVTRNLRRCKGRTILTAIGVTIGTAAIVAMMSLAIGLKDMSLEV